MTLGDMDQDNHTTMIVHTVGVYALKSNLLACHR